MKKLLLLSSLIITISSCQQEKKDLEQYTATEYLQNLRDEIWALKTQKEVYSYWRTLDSLDQQVLININDLREYRFNKQQRDSIATEQLIKAALLYELKFEESLKSYNTSPPIFNTHNNIAESSIYFWPVIQRWKDGDKILEGRNSFLYPSYSLEGASLSFYGYSLLEKDSIYPYVISQLDLMEYKELPEKIYQSYLDEQARQQLEIKETIGEWYEQSFANGELENRCFTIELLEDDHLYIRQYEYLQKLNSMPNGKNSKYLQIEKEPFNWKFELYDNAQLRLLNERNQELIMYTKCDYRAGM